MSLEIRRENPATASRIAPQPLPVQVHASEHRILVRQPKFRPYSAHRHGQRTSVLTHLQSLPDEIAIQDRNYQQHMPDSYNDLCWQDALTQVEDQTYRHASEIQAVQVQTKGQTTQTVQHFSEPFPPG